MPSLTFQDYYGKLTRSQNGFSGEVPPDFTLNTPVGNATDAHGNVWVCDTGNNRLVIFDDALENILQIITGVELEGGFSRFLLPFHLTAHPDRQQMFLTDMGNRRVVVLEYAKGRKEYVQFVRAFGDTPQKNFTPLSDPNGLAFVRESGKLVLFVTDEFFYSEGDNRNRCVKFSETGEFLDDFRQIRKGATINELKWPQGLAADSEGNLYLANTGDYEVLKCHTQSQIEGQTLQIDEDTERGDVFVHSFGNPTGAGFGNIIRGVDVIDDQVFIADQVHDKISVYDTSGTLLFVFGDMVPLFPAQASSLSDWWYYTLGNRDIMGPYSICKGKNAGEYFITEPILSRLIKIRIPELETPRPQLETSGADARLVPQLEVFLLKAVGKRRNQAGNAQQPDSQFNMVTSVMGAPTDPDSVATSKSLLDNFTQTLMAPYELFYNTWMRPFWQPSLDRARQTLYTIDAGNWTIKGYAEADNDFTEFPRAMDGLYVGGELAMTSYQPQEPMLGQIVPGSPLFLVSNFVLRQIRMYQWNLDGKLIGYGMPFGLGLRGPQGLTVSPDGAVYVADFVGNKVSKWQLLPTGQAMFVRDIRPEGDTPFMPMDVAVDRDGRVLVCDQVRNQILAFDSEGNPLWAYGKSGYCKNLQTEYDQFQLPTSVFVDENNHLIVNDLVNRALKVFEIKNDTLNYKTGKLLFTDPPEVGGAWMPFFLYARQGKIYAPDSAYNIVSVYAYEV